MCRVKTERHDRADIVSCADGSDLVSAQRTHLDPISAQVRQDLDLANRERSLSWGTACASVALVAHGLIVHSISIAASSDTWNIPTAADKSYSSLSNEGTCQQISSPV